MRKKYWIFLLIITGIEFFYFNFDALESRFFKQIRPDYEFVLSDGLFYNDDNTITVVDNKNAIVELKNINHLVDNVYVGLKVVNVDYIEKISIGIWMTDSGNEYQYYTAGNHDYILNAKNSHYLRLHPYGKLENLRLDFSDLENYTFQIYTIEFNAKVPFHFSWLRILIIASILLLIDLFRPHNPIFEYDFSSNSIKKPLLISLIAVILIGEISILNFMVYSIPIYRHNETFEHFMQYELLAESLSKGKFSLEIEPEENLINLSNPYDPTARSDFHWDYAFYNNKYYVYFGIVPVLIFYLPYYLITGTGLENVTVVFISLSLFALGVFLLLYEIITRFYNKIPISLYLLMGLTIVNGAGAIFIVRKPEIYSVPITLSLMFIAWGLWLWLRSVKTETKINRLSLFLGSLCMALVAGCRPQMVLVSFLAIPIFWNTLKNIFKEKEAFENFLIAILPFVIVACGLMYYNYQRFGSVLDFGANYNLTTNDMTKRNFNLSRIWTGVYNYVFQIPNLSDQYPFILDTPFHTNYLGITIIEPMYGGFFMTHPICWILVFVYGLKDKLNKVTFQVIIILIAISFCIIVMDIEMAGILPRYISDFSFFLLLASLLVLMSVIQYYSHRNWIRYLFAAIAFLLCICLFFDLFTFLIYDNANNYIQNPNLFYKIMGLFQY